MITTEATGASCGGQNKLTRKRAAQRKRAEKGRCPIHGVPMVVESSAYDDGYIGAVHIQDDDFIAKHFPDTVGANADRWTYEISVQGWRQNRIPVACPRAGCDVTALQDNPDHWEDEAPLYSIRGTGVIIE